MSVGKYLNDVTIPAQTIAGLDAALDRFLVHDASASGVAQVTASQILDRLLTARVNTALGTLSAISGLDLAADELLVWDNSVTAFVRIPASELIGKLLTRANITGLTNFTAMGSVDATNDRFLVWDASAAAFVTLTASELLARLTVSTQVNNTTTPITVTSAMSGQLLTNVGAAIAITFNLPASVAGLTYSFARHANVAMRVQPSGSEVIMDAAGGSYLEIQTPGIVTLRSLSGTSPNWLVHGAGAMFEYVP